jgi:hypothetical protein
MREAMSKEHADELQAAVQRAQDESATALAQAHIEFTAEKVEFDSMQKAAVAKAVVDTERMVTDRLEAAHRIDKEGLAQRQREFNHTLKARAPNKSLARGASAQPDGCRFRCLAFAEADAGALQPARSAGLAQGPGGSTGHQVPRLRPGMLRAAPLTRAHAHVRRESKVECGVESQAW